MRECPFCGYDEGWVKEDGGLFAVHCEVCGSHGPFSKTREGAEKKWEGVLKTIPTDEIDQALKEGIDILQPKPRAEIEQNFEELFGDKLDINSIYELNVPLTPDDDIDHDAKSYYDKYLKNFDVELIDFETVNHPGAAYEMAIKGKPIALWHWWSEYYGGDAEDFIYYLETDNPELFENIAGGVSAPMATTVNTPGMGSVTPAGTAAMTGAQQGDPNALGSGDKFGGDTPKKKKKRKKKAKKTNEIKSALKGFANLVENGAVIRVTDGGSTAYIKEWTSENIDFTQEIKEAKVFESSEAKARTLILNKKYFKL